MNSSQPLAQSVLGNLAVHNESHCLTEITDEDSEESLFGDAELSSDNFVMERKVTYLGEPRPTSLDGFISGKYQVAIECKFAESEVGSCSRPRLRPSEPNYEAEFWSWEPRFLYMLAATSGAVVMPFMLFYQASATAEKRVKSLWSSRLETLAGAIASEVGMVVILLATIGLNGGLIGTSSPKQLSRALSFLAGPYAPYVFAIGLIAASFLALVVVSLGSAWGVAETIGWGRQKFFWIYLLESLPALVVPMLFPNLFNLAIGMMVLFVFVLLGPGVLVGLIAGKKRVMGNLLSSLGWSAAYWVSLALVVASGVIALAAFFI